MTHRHFIHLLLASVSLAAVAAPALAQTAPQGDKSASTVTEVVVTAQKRKEKLQDVPLSISVASQAQLQSQQVNDIADLSRITPSLEIQQASNQNPGGGGQIRGIGTQTFAIGAVGSVGIVVDQVSQGNANISNLFDVSRVEVLKGPQGTLFGLTTSAGVINIVTNAPDPSHFSAAVHAEISGRGDAGSDYGQQVLQAVVNIPTSSDSALRVAANTIVRQGVDQNVLTGSFTQHDSYGVRAHYLWSPNDRLSVNLIGDYTYSDDRGADFFTITSATPGDAAALAACGVTAKPGNYQYCSNRPETNPGSVYGVSGQIDYDLGGATLTSITSVRRTIGGTGQDTDIFRDENTQPQIYTLDATSQSSLLTEEARIASPTGAALEYTAGVFLSRSTLWSGGGGLNVEVFPGPFPPFFPNGPNLGSNTKDTDQSQAVFGQATYHLTDQFRLIFGARYTHETLNLSQTDKNTLANSGFGSATEDNISEKVGVQYDVDKNMMAYATFSQGYKGPQLNVANPSVPAIIINPELPTDIEAGLKNTFFNGNIATDLSVFYDHVKNFQGQQCQPIVGGALSCGPVNYSAVDSKGIEFNVFGRPLPGLTVNSGLIYNPVKYPGGTLAGDGSGDLGGTQLGNAPLWKFTLSGEYSHPIADSVDGYVSVDTVYKSDLNLDNSLDPNLHYPAHWIVGGRIGARTHDGRFGAAIFVRNLTDQHEPVLIFPNFPGTGDYGTYYAPQSFRLVGVSLDAKF